MGNLVSPCQLIKPRNVASLRREITEEWLQEIIDRTRLSFRYFITLSFNRAQTSEISQYLDNHHIKKVILDFFYPNRKPHNRIRMWFFIEKHLSGYLHLHILMEGMDALTWLRKNNRRISLSKKTLFNIIASDYSMDDVITEALTNHLQSYVRRLGTGKQSVDMRRAGNIQKRVHYVNKSLSSLDFDGWQHIDFQNSDLQNEADD